MMRLSPRRMNAATAEQRAAEANRAAEQERLERVKLEAKIAPRFLSREEREVLSSRIRSAQVKLVDLFLYGSTPEIVRLSRQLAEALTSANRSEERRVGKECRSRWSRDH